MPFIVIEGIDGAGGETQSNFLKEFFKKNKIPAIFVASPFYQHPVGKLYRDYLDGKVNLSTEQVFLLCAMDVLNLVPRIKEGLRNRKVVVADRYITSTLAYRDAAGFPLEKGLEVVKVLDFPEADLIIFLDIKPETSTKRKLKEKESLDLHERNLEYLRRVRESYMKEISKNVLGEWTVIDGEKSKEEVFKEILKELKKRNLIKTEEF